MTKLKGFPRKLCLTLVERFEIDRRRRGLTQPRYSAALDTTPNRYTRFVQGFSLDPTGGDEGDTPAPEVGPLSPGEWCWIKRRRSGARLRDVGEALDMGTKWVHLAEKDETDAGLLVDYWQTDDRKPRA